MLWFCAARKVPATNGCLRLPRAASDARCFGKLVPRNFGAHFVKRKDARDLLLKSARAKDSSTLLLPPYVSATELRILFRIDYAGVFKLLGVRQESSKFYWKDHDGREFETPAKRKVLVPFDIAAIPARGLGMNPCMVDVEPDWIVNPDGPRAVPVVAVLGHINHGKTTLLDTLCQTAIAQTEPGGITQRVRATTAWVNPDGHEEVVRRMFANAYDDSGADDPADERRGQFRMTFLDTPGHEIFEVQRGRTMASADVALVVVSAERGVEVQTEEVLLHASRWKVPVIFALNKIDLPDAHIDLTRAELRRQCQRLFEAGDVDVDWTHEAETAVPISALYGRNLDVLLQKLREKINQVPSLPLRPVMPLASTPGEGRKLHKVSRRTDFLVGVETPPIAIALLVELERGADNGETILTLIVRSGRLTCGHYFVVGSQLGRISHLTVASEGDLRSWTPADSATAGMAVKICGLRPFYGGDCAPDDLLFTVPKERAWRLSEHRRRIEALSMCKIRGPPIEVPWEFDDNSVLTRTQAAFDRNRQEHPEKHSSSAYERRWQQPAVEEVTKLDELSPFTQASRHDFAAAFTDKVVTKASPTRLQGYGTAEDSSSDPQIESSRGPGRRSSRRFLVATPIEDTDPPEENEEEANFQSDGQEHIGAGRRSRRPTGAWTAPAAPQREQIYYTDRQTWTEEAEIDTELVRARWQMRDQERWKSQEKDMMRKLKEKEIIENMRRGVFGGDEEDKVESKTIKHKKEDIDEDLEMVEPLPLPRRNAPIIPMVLKTKTVSHFDVLMDEMERVQNEFGMRVVIVHGGLGPVIAKDVVHAEVEKHYGFCPIYAFQVGVHPLAQAQAEKERIQIRQYDVFTDLVADIVSRCEGFYKKQGSYQYAESLKVQQTPSGL